MSFVAVRGKLMVESLEGQDAGAMAAIMAPATAVSEALTEFPDVIVANINQLKQTVISGPTASVESALKAFGNLGYLARNSVSHAFHSPLMKDAAAALYPKIELLEFRPLNHPLHSAILEASISSGECFVKCSSATRRVLSTIWERCKTHLRAATRSLSRWGRARL